MPDFPARLQSDSAERRDGTRAGVTIEADIRKTGRTPFKVYVRDLSMTGCRAETLTKTIPGDRIWLTLPGFNAIEATIRWSNSRGCGIQWAMPLHPSVFDHIRQRYPDAF